MAITKSGTAYNDYKPVSRGDYGVRVARNGFDAVTSSDSNLLFNSGWRIIQIVRVISEANKVVHVDETRNIPSGYVYVKTTYGGVGDWNCGVDENWFYLPIEYLEYRDSNYRQYTYKRQYKIYHGLGYMPLFFKSKFCSDVPGYYILTNIDIRQDVDYPYTSKPSYYDGNTKNYGIKSKSHTRSKLPAPGETRGCGINTSIQSKLVMAVKTDKTRTSDKNRSGTYQGRAACPAWAVPGDSNAQTTKLTDYEVFGFFEENNDGILYEQPAGPDMEYNDIYSLIAQWLIQFQQSKSSLVVLRSPMVAPDLEEFRI